MELDDETRVDLILAGEMLVDRALADLGLGRDLVDGHALPVVPIEQRQRGREDVLLAALELPLLAIDDRHDYQSQYD